MRAIEGSAGLGLHLSGKERAGVGRSRARESEDDASLASGREKKHARKRKEKIPRAARAFRRRLERRSLGSRP